MSTHPKTRSAIIALIHWALLFFWQFSHAATIQGTVFNDLNNNGTFDSCEPVLPNTTISIRDAGEIGLFTRLTDANGNYLSTSHNPGNFTLWSDIPNGWEQTTPVKGTGIVEYDLTIANSSDTLTIDFGLRNPATPVQNCTICDTVTEIPKAQCNTLVALYDSTDGDNWTDNTGWKITNTPCSWYGVTCVGNSITKIELAENKLNGPIPESLDNLNNLLQLQLQENQLSGPIPESLGNLNYLRYLYLYNNQLSGPLLASLGNLGEELLSLQLYNNQLSGTIPESLAQLSNLRTLLLSENQLSGPIPESLSNLSHLKYLRLSGNQFSGPIPESLGNLNLLLDLELDRNQLSDPIPSSLGDLSNLKYLYLNNNQLSGPILALNTLSKLETLRLNGNPQLCQNPNANYGNWTEVDEFPACDDPNYGLVLHLPFDGDANDISGNGNNGTVNGATLTLDRHGNPNSAYEFDGIDDYIEIQNSDSLNPKHITVSAWYYVTKSFSGNGNNAIIGKPYTEYFYPYVQWHIGITGEQYESKISSTFPKFNVGISNNNIGMSAHKRNVENFIGIWHHVVMSFDGISLKLYVNGKLESSSMATSNFISSYDTNVFIGKSAFFNRQGIDYTPAIIDDIFVYNRALSASEIQIYYNSTKPATTGCNGDTQLPGNLCENLIAYYPLDNNSNDVTGNGNNGIEQGGLNYLAGIQGQAANFDGIDDYIEVPDSTNLHFGTDSLSVSMWFNANTFEGKDRAHEGIRPLSKNGYPDTWWVTDILPNGQNGQIQMSMKDSDGVRILDKKSTTVITTEQWYHLVMAVDRDNSELRYYLNGTLDATHALPAFGDISIQGHAFEIGSGIFNPFNGLIDELYLHRRVLTDAEIQSLYESTKPFTGCNAVTAPPTAQCEALLAFYDSTNGDKWTNQDGWKQNNTPCSWHGVACQDGVVIRLSLAGNNLTGTLPDEIGALTDLTKLRLDNNQITGAIPTTLNALTKLETLWLYRNQFSGVLPDLSGLTELVDFPIHHNQLEGSIPAWFNTLTKLTRLHLDDNNFSGTIPDWNNLVNMESLRISNNQLEGPIPALNTLTNLQEIWVKGDKESNKLCRNPAADYAGHTSVNAFEICPDVILVAEASTAEVCIGQNFTVTVQKQLTQNVDAIEMGMTFDANTLKVNSLTNNSGLDRELLNQFNNTDGTLQFAAAKVVGDGVGGEFDVATISLTALEASANSTVQFDEQQTLITLKGGTLRPKTEPVTISSKVCTEDVPPPVAENNFVWTLIDEQAGLSAPKSIIFDTPGNAYMADSLNHRILKRDINGDLTVIAGTGKAGYSGDNDPASEAKLNTPLGLALDSADNLYIADQKNNRIRMIQNGQITTVAGSKRAGYAGDGGLATVARLRNPADIVLDSNDNLYIADSGNHRIRKVNTQGIITTFAGKGKGYSGDGGVASNARFNQPSGLAFDSRSHLYIADTENHCIRKIDPRGMISTVAGHNKESGYTGDGNLATTANLNAPTGIVLDNAGNLYIADKNNHRIRKVDENNIITTMVGTGKRGTTNDGALAAVAKLNTPWDVALDNYGNLYIADKGNNLIRKVGNMKGDEDDTIPPIALTDCNTVTEIPPAECYALIALADSTALHDWTTADGWKTTDTPCSWNGVTCENGTVTEISLSNNNLVGDIPDQISALSNLSKLDLSHNQVSGAIPATINGLNNLANLNLTANQMTGAIPNELGDLTQLQSVSLAQNQLGGEIPDLTPLNQLKELDLSDNLLSGPVPDFTALPALETVKLAGENQQLCTEGEPTAEYQICPTENQLPTAAFTATPKTGEAPLTVQLDARISTDPYGTVTNYFWETSDEQILTGATPSITFQNSDLYEIRLKVMDNDGAPSLNTAKQLIEVSPAPNKPTLTLSKEGTGLGTIMVKRDKETVLKCQPDCQEQSEDLPLGSELKITASATKGSMFTGWSSDCVGTDEQNKITLIMDAPKQCTAVFELEPVPPPKMHALTINSKPAEFWGDGDVKVNDLLCEEPPCMSYHQQGKKVKITATPIPHAYFFRWDYDCPILGTFEDATNLVVLTSDATCTAYFGNDSIPASENTAQEFEQEGELSSGESVTEIYPEVVNRERYEQAFLIAEQAMKTAETQMIIPGEESWPDQFNQVENFLKLPPNLWVKKVRIVSGEENIGRFHIQGQYVRVDVLLLNQNGNEDLVPVLIYYQDKPTLEETAPPPMEENNTRRGVRYGGCWWCRPIFFSRIWRRWKRY